MAGRPAGASRLPSATARSFAGVFGFCRCGRGRPAGAAGFALGGSAEASRSVPVGLSYRGEAIRSSRVVLLGGGEAIGRARVDDFCRETACPAWNLPGLCCVAEGSGPASQEDEAPRQPANDPAYAARRTAGVPIGEDRDIEPLEGEEPEQG